MTLPCATCATRGPAVRLSERDILCPLGGARRLDGEQCAYSVTDLDRKAAEARSMLERIAAIRALAEDDAQAHAYWDCTSVEARQTFASQRGVFREELARARSVERTCPTCANHDGECVCVAECNLGSKYERRDGND